MIFPGFPGVLSFFQVFQVFQVEWEPWEEKSVNKQVFSKELNIKKIFKNSRNPIPNYIY